MSITLQLLGQAGSLDTSFSTDGWVITEMEWNEFATDVGIQSDGKIVAAGTTNSGFEKILVVTRHHTNGVIDSSFSFDGIATAGFLATTTSLCIQADQKILVGGYFSTLGPEDENFFLMRFKSNGDLDSIFGTNGQVSTDFDTGDDYAHDITVQPDGKIIVVGYSGIGNPIVSSFALARYNPNGTLDNTFGSGGKIKTLIDSYANAFSVALESDGQIVVGGRSIVSSNTKIAFARYNANGTLDGNFGTNGRQSFDIANQEYIQSIAIQYDGKIIAAGGIGTVSGTSADFGIIRLNTNGSLDTDFGVNGVVTTDFGSLYESASSVVIQPDGKIVAAGNSTVKIALARYLPDGMLDPAFGIDGKLTTLIGLYSSANSLALQSNGNIIAAGGISADFALFRYISDLNIGIFEAPYNNTLLIYPNPLSDQAILIYTLLQEEKINIRLYDVEGTIVQEFLSSEQKSKGKHKEMLTIKDALPPGYYILEISGNKNAQRIKVILD